MLFWGTNHTHTPLRNQCRTDKDRNTTAVCGTFPDCMLNYCETRDSGCVCASFTQAYDICAAKHIPRK